MWTVVLVVCWFVCNGRRKRETNQPQHNSTAHTVPFASLLSLFHWKACVIHSLPFQFKQRTREGKGMNERKRQRTRKKVMKWNGSTLLSFLCSFSTHSPNSQSWFFSFLVSVSLSSLFIYNGIEWGTNEMEAWNEQRERRNETGFTSLTAHTTFFSFPFLLFHFKLTQRRQM